MRTMLIPVLLCSLAQFAIADPPTKKVEGCATIFTCYVPENCDNPTKALGASKVKYLDVGDEISEDCDAIFKFHKYQEHWAHVSMESWKKKDFVKQIKFVMTKSNGEKAEFSCEFSNDVLVGKYGADEKSSQDKQIPDNIKCEYELILPFSEKVFKAFDTTEKLQIFVDVVPTKSTGGILLPGIRCDPSAFKFEEKPDDTTHVYASVTYKAGEYYCNDKNIYELEFLPSTGLPYQTIQDIKCVDDKFHLGGETITDGWIYVRCKADAQYFCDYKPRNRAQLADHMRALEPDMPDTNPPKKGSLKCPDEFPYLFMEKFAPLKNPTFKCLNYGGVQYWTVNDKVAHLTKKGPEVYCSSKVDCNLLHKIPAKSIKEGFINERYVPECYEHGSMYVGDKVVTDPRCDTATGEYKYSAAGAEQLLTPDTEFVCKYPTEYDEKEQKENEDMLTQGRYISFGGIAGAVVLCSGLGLAFVCIKNKMQKRADKKRTENQMETLLTNGNEKKKLAEAKKAKEKKNKKNQKPEETSSKREERISKEKTSLEKKKDPMSWNKMLMHLQYVNENFLDRTDVGEEEESKTPGNKTVKKTVETKKKNWTRKFTLSPKNPAMLVDTETMIPQAKDIWIKVCDLKRLNKKKRTEWEAKKQQEKQQNQPSPAK